MNDDRIQAATRAVKAELEDYPDARQSAWNIAAAALRASGALEASDSPRAAATECGCWVCGWQGRTDLPIGAIDAVEASLRTFLARWTDFTVHGTDLDSQLRGAAMIAVRETLAHGTGE